MACVSAVAVKPQPVTADVHLTDVLTVPLSYRPGPQPAPRHKPPVTEDHLRPLAHLRRLPAHLNQLPAHLNQLPAQNLLELLHSTVVKAPLRQLVNVVLEHMAVTVPDAPVVGWPLRTPALELPHGAVARTSLARTSLVGLRSGFRKSHLHFTGVERAEQAAVAPRYSGDSRPRHSGDSRLRHSGDSRPRHSGEGPAPYDSGSGRSSGIVAPGPGDHLSTDPAAYQYGIHQMQGAYRQRWLQVDYAADCPFIMRSPLQYLEMINRTNPADRWSIDRNSFVQSPIGFDSELASQGLPSGPNTYRKIRLNGPVQWGVYNEYVHMTANGVIFAMDITRDSLYHWSDIAVGQYTMDFRIETLRRIYFHHVINEDTHGFMMDLYRSTMEGGFSRNPAAERQIVWSLGTPEYQAILGTTFGKGVAALLLTYFPRGTVIVARIVTWRQQDLHMRFDIEPVSYMEGQ
ncbi:hypothetical protein N7541_001071 [Penicillium brevicompactum]|uniref:Uncharacterized protein n=1 Tax=Penicillium brevicompactum TaxID=5074 RepID=A0A9W9RVI0_PENBR|nr:hypothetical protein N7541_001071 [Penicillium brevicompactum]